MHLQAPDIEGLGQNPGPPEDGNLSEPARADAVHIVWERFQPPSAISLTQIDQLIAEIRQLWAQDTIRILDVATRMEQVRRSLKHRRGAWTGLWRSRQLPFGKRKGERLAVIGQATEGLNASDSTHLPPAWNTLYCLARLGHRRLNELIDAGEVHPALRLEEAKALLARFNGKPAPSGKASALRQRVRRFCAFVDSTWDNLTHADRQWVEASLRELLDRQTFTTTNRPHNTTLPGVTS
jgi:hypothetical protein